MCTLAICKFVSVQAVRNPLNCILIDIILASCRVVRLRELKYKKVSVMASLHTQQTFQLHFIRRELVVGKTWVTKLQNAPCNDANSTTLKMQVAREINFHIVHTYVIVRSLPF